MCDAILSVATMLGSTALAGGKPLLLATLAQHFWQWFYYACICGERWARYLAEDKGVKNMEHIKWRYSMGLAIMVSFVASFFRALFILFVSTHIAAVPTLCGLTQAALFVTAVGLAYKHLEIMSQRGFVLMFADVVSDLSGALVAAVVLYYA